MSTYKKNLELLTKNNVYSKEMEHDACGVCLLYTSPSPRDMPRSRMPSSA